MASEKLQYDGKVGGSVMLDTHMSTYRYAASALKEIRQLLNEVNDASENSSKLVFQSLPKHLRRRAMSHHPKRLPRKYRAVHCAQMAKAGAPAKLERPSRKYRRRPRNLMKEYIRRQRRNIWLETHIWHAKRFHMIDRWGYRLPYASCDKTYRACYRATTQHCLLQDISYYACIELMGQADIIGNGFKSLTSAKCGLSIVARTFLAGRREGSIHLFKAEHYPNGAIGRVSFMWCPVEEEQSIDDTTMKRKLWLWVHPAIYTCVLIEILKVFELISTKSITVPITDDECAAMAVHQDEIVTKTDDTKSVKKPKKPQLTAKIQKQLQFMTKTLAYERIKRYKNDRTGLELSELKDTMNRFRLTGPLSQTVLTNAFKNKAITTGKKDKTPNWFEDLLSANDKFHSLHIKQSTYWEKCQALSTPGQLMSNMILGLNIDDPRIHRPQKRTKALPTEPMQSFDAADLLLNADTQLPQSCLWQASIRDRLCADMLTTQAYSDKRAKQAAVPGAKCKFEYDLQPVPVLLIQRPGSQLGEYKRLGYGCGWDVILPAGYGISVWLALTMRGAKPGGLRESDSIAREMGMEQHLPDAIAGKQHAAERHAELRAKYFRLPTNKRCNYRKIAIVSPFRAPFAQLVRDWQQQEQQAKATTTAITTSYYVLRDRQQLHALNEFLQNKTKFPESINAGNCLVQVQLRMKTRGHPDDFAIICIATERDLKRNLKHIKQQNHDPIYMEPLLSDPSERERKQLRAEHKKLLKRLRARRVRAKRKLQETATKRVHISPANTSQLNSAHASKMATLWLPEDFDTLFTVRKQCTRDVFGYITNANFCYTEAICCGIGYMSLEGLKVLMSTCRQLHLKQPMCLVRGTTSRHYRFATFKLNLDV